MMMKYCMDRTILDTTFLDPTMVTEALGTKKPEETENYIVDFFLEHQKNNTYSYLTPSSIYLTI
jgi:predicted DNA-binding protein (UPF0278 family)